MKSSLWRIARRIIVIAPTFVIFLAMAPCLASAQVSSEEKLMLAAFSGDMAAVKKQVDAGADIMKRNHNEATPLLLDSFEGLTDKLGPDHPDALDSANDLGALYKALGRFDEARPLLIKAWEGRRQKFGTDHPDTLASLNHIIALFEVWRKPQETMTWREKLPSP